MKSKSAYLASLRANEMSLELYEKIGKHPTGKAEAYLRTALIKVTSTFVTDLEKCGALTPERHAWLENAQIEAASSVALAWGALNSAVIDVMEKEV
jgi:hypothetical protein